MWPDLRGGYELGGAIGQAVLPSVELGRSQRRLKCAHIGCGLDIDALSHPCRTGSPSWRRDSEHLSCRSCYRNRPARRTWRSPSAFGRESAGSTGSGPFLVQQVMSVRLGQATPHSERFGDPEGMCPALREDRTFPAQRFGPVFAIQSSATAFSLGGEEHRGIHPSASRVQLPMPLVRVAMCHEFHPSGSGGRRPGRSRLLYGCNEILHGLLTCAFRGPVRIRAFVVKKPLRSAPSARCPGRPADMRDETPMAALIPPGRSRRKPR